MFSPADAAPTPRRCSWPLESKLSTAVRARCGRPSSAFVRGISPPHNTAQSAAPPRRNLSHRHPRAKRSRVADPVEGVGRRRRARHGRRRGARHGRRRGARHGRRRRPRHGRRRGPRHGPTLWDGLPLQDRFRTPPLSAAVLENDVARLKQEAEQLRQQLRETEQRLRHIEAEIPAASPANAGKRCCKAPYGNPP